MKIETIRLEDFGRDFAAEFKWISDNRATFEFAEAMWQRIRSHGFLSPGMMAAIHRCMARTPQASAPVNTGELEAVFKRVNPTLRKPALNVGEFRFSPAPDTGKNPGAIYVKQDGQYLGKMLGGKFLARCTEEAMQRVLAIAADPLGEAIKHGRITGRCAICNRNLKDEDSTNRGIGQVCAAKFGWENL